ncbi:M20/M25/M40 family metallo-hydrolase [Wukongibacter baidiensis]|uniref:M20/M25/M40 family metallo-hydrolase n=1 Tax=Wukongibacter baidiensis TaxID=1723361 RepID=UPI003D7F8D40
MLRNSRFKVLSLIMILVLLTSSVSLAAPVHKDIFDEVSADKIYNHIANFADRDNARITGFEGEHNTADYIDNHFESYGLKVERQKFPILAFLDNGAELNMIAPNEREFNTINFSYTPPTPHAGLTAELVYAGVGGVDDFENINVKNKIALIQRGSYTFNAKTQNAANAGAIGVIIFNHSPGIINGTLGEPTDIPAIALSDEDGGYLLSLLEDGKTVEVTMKANTELEESYSQNVIGTLPASRGNGKKAQTIVIGAHYDCVDTPGANDNASGAATLLEVARVLSSKKMAYNIKFIAFGAEEVGLVGSYEYVSSLSESELGDIVAMINMDMVGVGDTMGVMTLTEDSVSFVADLAETYIKEFGHKYERSASSRSDHAPFEEAGIPVVFLNYGPDDNYHTDEDSLDKISKADLYNMGTLVTAMTYDMAKTPMPHSANGLKAKVNKYKNINPEIPAE